MTPRGIRRITLTEEGFVMSSRLISRKARLMATTSMVALTLATSPVAILTLGDEGFFNTAYAESCCFVGDTQVTLADGQSCPISAIVAGTLVMGSHGRANRVVRVERPRLGRRKLYAFNGGRPFVTAEHPFKTEQGWKSIDPVATFREAPTLTVNALRVGDRVAQGRMSLDMPTVGATALAPEPRMAPHHVPIESIDASDADPELVVFNLILKGDHTYLADSFLVHNKGGDDDGGSSGGGESGGSGGSGGGESGGSGGSGGGESGGSGGSGGGESGQSGQSGQSGESGDVYLYLDGQRPDAADLRQVGVDLTAEQECAVIEGGWR